MKPFTLMVASVLLALGTKTTATAGFTATLTFGTGLSADTHDGGANDKVFEEKTDGWYFRTGVTAYENEYYKIEAINSSKSVLTSKTFPVQIQPNGPTINVTGITLTNIKITFKEDLGAANQSQSAMTFVQFVETGIIDKAGVRLGHNSVRFFGIGPHDPVLQLTGFVDDTKIGTVRQSLPFPKSGAANFDLFPVSDGKIDLNIPAGKHKLRGDLVFTGGFDKGSTLTLSESGEVGVATPAPAGTTMLATGALFLLGYRWCRRNVVGRGARPLGTSGLTCSSRRS